MDVTSAGSSTTTFTSAYRPKHRDASTPRRRRGSESTADNGSTRTLGHSRSLTEGHGKHPLRERKSSRSSSRPGLGLTPGMAAVDATRPRLYRMLSSDIDLSERDDTTSPTGEQEERGRSTVRDEEMTVLVHQVLPSDSLAGVALKHDVTISDLRRVNKLWASDSIHLRKVLYIPLTKARLAAIDSATPVSPPASSADDPDPWSLSEVTSPTSEIRRVPASQLSFFPPPSRPALSEDTSSSSDRPSRSNSFASRSKTLPRPRPPAIGAGSGTGFSPLSAFFPSTPSGPVLNGTGNTLSSLLSALPINLQRPLGGRVSLDSTHGSSPSTSTSDLEHEMGDVSHRRQRRRSFGGTPRPSDDTTLGTNGDGDCDDLISFDTFSPPSGRKTPTLRARKIAAYTAPTPPRSPGPQPVRTAQMAPSPAMQLPLSPVGMKSDSALVSPNARTQTAYANGRRAVR